MPANRRAGPELVNLGLAGHGTGKFVGDFLLFGIDEAHQGGADLNGDGDALDQVYHLLRP